MILKSTQYTSPIPTEGTFENVYITEKAVTIEKARKYMLIEFEMYDYILDKKITLDERSIAFYGNQGDTVTSNKLAIISVVNKNYDAEVASIPLTIEVINPEYQPEFLLEPNPEYNAEIEGSEEFISTPNPLYDINIAQFITIENSDYENQVASVQKNISVPFLQYLQEHEGDLPEIYEVVEWGFPNFQDALQYFSGGEKSNLDISITNPFARGWLLNTLVMKNERVGVQFNFED